MLCIVPCTSQVMLYVFPCVHSAPPAGDVTSIDSNIEKTSLSSETTPSVVSTLIV